jgi:putative flippase GtrA
MHSFAKYIIVGVLTVLLDFFVFTLLNYISSNHIFSEVNKGILLTIFNYLGHSEYSFRYSKNHNLRKKYILKYLITVCLVITFQTLTLDLIVRVSDLSIEIAKLIQILIWIPVGFSLLRFWVFK